MAPNICKSRFPEVGWGVLVDIDVIELSNRFGCGVALPIYCGPPQGRAFTFYDIVFVKVIFDDEIETAVCARKRVDAAFGTWGIGDCEEKLVSKCK
jgi:hypothetical protein